MSPARRPETLAAEDTVAGRVGTRAAAVYGTPRSRRVVHRTGAPPSPGHPRDRGGGTVRRQGGARGPVARREGPLRRVGAAGSRRPPPEPCGRVPGRAGNVRRRPPRQLQQLPRHARRAPDVERAGAPSRGGTDLDRRARGLQHARNDTERMARGHARLRRFGPEPRAPAHHGRLGHTHLDAQHPHDGAAGRGSPGAGAAGSTPRRPRYPPMRCSRRARR